MRRSYTTPSGEQEVSFTIHEAYYPAVGEKADSITKEPVDPHGETIEELRESLERMLRALNHPVLEYSDF